MSKSQPWIFNDPKDLAVLSLRRIFDGETFVRMVTHEDDGSWQFLDGHDMTEKDAVIVGHGEVIKLDPTLVQVAALPRGWYAVREAINTPWWVAPGDMEIKDYYESLETNEDEEDAER